MALCQFQGQQLPPVTFKNGQRRCRRCMAVRSGLTGVTRLLPVFACSSSCGLPVKRPSKTCKGLVQAPLLQGFQQPALPLLPTQ